MQVELQDGASGATLPGFELANCVPIIVDAVNATGSGIPGGMGNRTLTYQRYRIILPVCEFGCRWLERSCSHCSL